MAGSCNRCGACCSVIPMLRGNLAPETVEWLLARGGRIEGKYVLLPQKCQHLVLNEIEIVMDHPDGHATIEKLPTVDKCSCDIHGTDQYPKLCRQYHGHGARFYKPPGCGYLK